MKKKSSETLEHKRSFFVRMVSDPKLYNPKIVKIDRRQKLQNMGVTSDCSDISPMWVQNFDNRRMMPGMHLASCLSSIRKARNISKSLSTWGLPFTFANILYLIPSSGRHPRFRKWRSEDDYFSYHPTILDLDHPWTNPNIKCTKLASKPVNHPGSWMITNFPNHFESLPEVTFSLFSLKKLNFSS